jgi:hypothetical protein
MAPSDAWRELPKTLLKAKVAEHYDFYDLE